MLAVGQILEKVTGPELTWAASNPPDEALFLICSFVDGVTAITSHIPNLDTSKFVFVLTSF